MKNYHGLDLRSQRLLQRPILWSPMNVRVR